MITFRNLYPTEIQIRPTDTKFKGSATLLLFQDARCGMDILDETVGAENWQKEYYEVKGNVYCRVGIKVGDEFVWKSDCGIESNVDAQKGEASDAFKRAVVNWGIGRELYSGPRIKINCPDNYYYNDKLTMTFFVHSISYDGKKITALTICDRFDNIVFNWDCNNGVILQTKPVEENLKQSPTQQTQVNNNAVLDGLKAFCAEQKETADRETLKKFYSFWSKKCENWRGKMDYANLWQRWNQPNPTPQRYG